MKLTHGPTAMARFPSTHKGYGSYTKNLQIKCTGNPSLPNVPDLSAFGDEVDTLITADNIKHKTPEQVADRDAKALKVFRHVGRIVNYVQTEADKQSSEADAIALILGSGLDVRKTRVFKKPALAARYTGLTGEALLVALAIAGAGAYYWEYSLDQVNWTAEPETRDPRTTIKGLKVGQTYYFRFRVLTGKGKSDHLSPVSLLVH